MLPKGRLWGPSPPLQLPAPVVRGERKNDDSATLSMPPEERKHVGLSGERQVADSEGRWVNVRLQSVGHQACPFGRLLVGDLGSARTQPPPGLRFAVRGAAQIHESIHIRHCHSS